MRAFGNILFGIAASLSAAILAAGLYVAFTNYRDGKSYDTGLIVIALAAAIMGIGIFSKQVIRDR